MSTEILGFFIILGVLVLVVLRRNDWPSLLSGEKHDGRIEEAEDASVRLRHELEHSADEIIARIGDRIQHLKQLVAEAERKSDVIEDQIRRLDMMQRENARTPSRADGNHPSAFWMHPDVSRELLREPLMSESLAHAKPLHEPTIFSGRMRELSDSPKPLDEPQHFEEVLEASMAISSNTNDYARRASSPLFGYDAEPEVVVSPSVADVVGIPLTPKEAAGIESATVDGTSSTEDDSFASEGVSFELPPDDKSENDPLVGELLEIHDAEILTGASDMEVICPEMIPHDGSEETERKAVEEAPLLHNDEEPGEIPAPEGLFIETMHDESEETERKAVEEALQLHGGGIASRVRTMLDQGKSVDEIARAEGMGRGAIELIMQMEKNKTAVENA